MELIDRGAAIDAFNTGLNELVVGGEENAKTVENYLNRVIETIKCLPSATDTNVGTKLGTNLAEVGTDLISRQALLDKFEPWLKVKDYNDGELNMLKAILYEIRLMRPVQPEIIRCKDCKHWIPYDWMFSEVWQSKNIADYPEDEIGCDCCDMAMKANDFCSRAERRTK